MNARYLAPNKCQCSRVLSPFNSGVEQIESLLMSYHFFFSSTQIKSEKTGKNHLVSSVDLLVDSNPSPTPLPIAVSMTDSTSYQIAFFHRLLSSLQTPSLSLSDNRTRCLLGHKPSDSEHGKIESGLILSCRVS